MSPGGEIGRHAGLKILWPEMAVRVQVPPRVQKSKNLTSLISSFSSLKLYLALELTLLLIGSLVEGLIISRLLYKPANIRVPEVGER
jgi:hypothetical protein